MPSFAEELRKRGIDPNRVLQEVSQPEQSGQQVNLQKERLDVQAASAGARAEKKGDEEKSKRQRELEEPPVDARDQLEAQKTMNEKPPSFEEAIARRGIDPEKVAKRFEQRIDPITGKMRPRYANGSGPETAINQSPLSPNERFQLSLGNEKGNIATLKKKFEDAKKTKAGLAVKKDGLWYQVDPEGLGTADAWDVTKGIFRSIVELNREVQQKGERFLNMGTEDQAKQLKPLAERDPLVNEMLSEVRENVPLASLILGSAATGGSLTGLAAVGGATEAVRTSLGRMEGTYSATPEEQIGDIAFEASINAAIPGGGKVLFKAGQKVSGTAVGKALIEGAKKGGTKMSEAAKNTWASTIGRVSMGKEAMKRTLDRPGQIGREMLRVSKHAKTNNVPEEQSYAELSARSMLNIAKKANKEVSRLYDDGIEKFKEVMPSNFKWDGNQVMRPVFDDLVNQGVGTIDDAGNFALKSRSELAALPDPDDFILELVNNKKAYKNIVESVAKIQNMSRLKGTGTKAADLLKSTDKAIKSQFRSIHKKKALDNGFNSSAQRIQRMMDTFDGSLDDFSRSQLSGNVQAISILRNTKATYSDIMENSEAIIGGFRQGAKTGKVDKKSFTLAKKLMSNPEKNPYEAKALRTVKTSLGSRNSSLLRDIDRFEDMRAAAAQHPFIHPVLKDRVSYGVLGATSAYGIGTTNPTIAAFILGTGAATSPRLAGWGVRSGNAVLSGIDDASKQIMANNGLNAVHAMNVMRKRNQLDDFVKNDTEFSEFINQIVQVPNIEQDVNSILQEAAGGGQ